MTERERAGWKCTYVHQLMGQWKDKERMSETKIVRDRQGDF